MKTVIEQDAYDTLVFDGVSEYRKVSDLISRANDQSPVIQDTFASLYKMDPKIVEEAPRLGRELMETLQGLPEYQQLRATTQLDEISSTLGTLALAPDLVKQAQEIAKKQESRQKSRQMAGKPGDGKDGENGAGGDDPGLNELLGEQGMSQLRGTMRRALEKAQGDAEEWGEVASGWGIKEGELKQLPVAERLSMAQKLLESKSFRNVAELAGRFKNVVNAASATTTSHGFEEIVDITFGSSISQMLPSEAAKLLKTPVLFYKDMLEGKLLNYNLKGVENLGKGPIIVAMDISASMSGPRAQWAMAATMALMQLAEKEKRAFGFIAFDTKVRQRHFWPKNAPVSIQEKIGLASIESSGGGTSFDAPVQVAFEMRAKEPELKPADVVFITDGECELSSDQVKATQKAKKETNVRFFGIAVDGFYAEKLTTFCDQITVVKNTGEMESFRSVTNSVAATATGRSDNGGQFK